MEKLVEISKLTILSSDIVAVSMTKTTNGYYCLEVFIKNSGSAKLFYNSLDECNQNLHTVKEILAERVNKNVSEKNQINKNYLPKF